MRAYCPMTYGGLGVCLVCSAGCMQGDETPNVRRKRALLESEGVAFTSDGARVSAACLASEAVLAAAAVARAQAQRFASTRAHAAAACFARGSL